MEKTPQQSASRNSDKYIVRLPDGMRDALAQRAKGENRSMNAEIVAILEAALADEGGVAALADGLLLDEVVGRYGARGFRVVVEPKG